MLERPNNCTFLAFKLSGKMYSSERGYLPKEVFEPYLRDGLAAILIDHDGKWPGLSGAGHEFTRVVVPDHDLDYGFPFLINPRP